VNEFGEATKPDCCAKLNQKKNFGFKQET